VRAAGAAYNLPCMRKRCRLVLFNPHASFLPHSFPLMRANAPVHNSCASEVSPQPNCETVAIFLWPANRPFVGCLLRLNAQPVLLLLAGSAVSRGLLSGIRTREQPLLGLGLGLGLGLLLLLLRLPGAAGRGVPLTIHDRQRPGKG
jgi:hypothetical protein